MKKVISFLLIGICCSLAYSSSAQTSDTRQVGTFSSVNISGGYDKVIFVPGTMEEVIVTAKGIEADKILTYVKDKCLNIETKKGYSGSNEVTIQVTYRLIEEINNSGSSDLLLKGAMKSEKLEINASGSGDIEGEVSVNELEINISGSSDIRLSGKAVAQEYNISGSGDVQASKLRGERASVSISGSGDVQLNVSGAVKSRVSGSGHVQNTN